MIEWIYILAAIDLQFSFLSFFNLCLHCSPVGFGRHNIVLATGDTCLSARAGFSRSAMIGFGSTSIICHIGKQLLFFPFLLFCSGWFFFAGGLLPELVVVTSSVIIPKGSKRIFARWLFAPSVCLFVAICFCQRLVSLTQILLTGIRRQEQLGVFKLYWFHIY